MKSFVKIKDVQPGNILIADDGFSCLEKGERRRVYRDPGGLYINCKPDQKHYLDGQINGDEYTGFYKGHEAGVSE